jgi:hypothetical protein
MHFPFSPKSGIIGKKDDNVKIFDYSKLADRTWDNEIVSYFMQINDGN